MVQMLMVATLMGVHDSYKVNGAFLRIGAWEETQCPLCHEMVTTRAESALGTRVFPEQDHAKRHHAICVLEWMVHNAGKLTW